MKKIQLKKFGPILDACIAKLVEEGYLKSYPASVVQEKIKEYLLSNEFTDAIMHEQDKHGMLLLSFPTTSPEDGSDAMVHLRSNIHKCGWCIVNDWIDENSKCRCISLKPKWNVMEESDKA